MDSESDGIDSRRGRTYEYQECVNVLRAILHLVFIHLSNGSLSLFPRVLLVRILLLLGVLTSSQRSVRGATRDLSW